MQWVVFETPTVSHNNTLTWAWLSRGADATKTKDSAKKTKHFIVFGK